LRRDRGLRINAALGAVGKVVIDHDRAHRGQRRMAEAVIDDQRLVLGDEAAELLRIVGIAGARPAVIEIERAVADREGRATVVVARDEIAIPPDGEADDVCRRGPGRWAGCRRRRDLSGCTPLQSSSGSAGP
jgi:hypothetical protein